MALVGKFGSRMLPLLARRSLTTTATRQEVHPVYAKMKENSKKFQINNGLGVSVQIVLSSCPKGMYLMGGGGRQRALSVNSHTDITYLTFLF